MHESVHAWVASQVAACDLAGRAVLEVGSLDVNGGVRDLFAGPYIGVDMREGRGVDRVMDAHDLDFPSASFDVVICCEMVEHDPAYWLSLTEISRVLRPGGYLLLTTRGNGFHLHGEPSDYWRFMPAAGPVLADLAGCDLDDQLADPQVSGIFLRGVRR